MRIRVECSRDAHGNEVPALLGFDGRTVAITEVVDRWPGRDHCYFKLKGEDGALYVIRHDEAGAGWELTLFERGVASGSGLTLPRGS